MIQPLFADVDSMDATPYPRHDLCEQGSDDQGNERVAVTLFADELSLEHFILSAACQPEYTTFFRAAAPEWNQPFRWCSMDSRVDGVAAMALQPLIDASFNDAGPRTNGHSPNGVASLPARWTWLALGGVRLKVVPRGDVGKLPLKNSASLLGIDVWESAYFLDFGNRDRVRLHALLDNLSHWQFAIDNLSMGRVRIFASTKTPLPRARRCRGFNPR